VTPYQVGTAIFSFVIAAHTFSLLFLRRQWPNRTSYITLIVAWAVLVLDMCIGKFLEARGAAFYGIAGNWCWISPAYPTEGYTTEYLFMFASVGLSFILYLLVFFRLRGNITVSAGYKLQFHHRPKVSVSRTNAGAYIMTDDRRAESHLTAVGKQLLWHPIAYSVLVLPFAVTRSSYFSGASVPFPVTAFAAAAFVLSGFANAVLFCTTRSVLPERWRQRLSIGTTSDGGRGVPSLPSQRNLMRRRVESGARMVVGPKMASVVLDISMEKEFGNYYSESDRSPSSLKFSPPTSPTRPLRAYGGRRRADTESYHTVHLSFSPLRNEMLSLRSSGADGDGEDSDFSAAVRPASKVKRIIEEVPAHPAHESREHESAIYEPAPGLEDPASFHPFDTTTIAHTDTRRPRVPSMLTFENAVHHIYASDDFRGSGSGIHWTAQRKSLSRTQHIGGYSPTVVGQHPYSRPSLAPNQDVLLEIERNIRGHQAP